MRYLRNYWYWIVIGIVLTANAMRDVYEVRGYVSYGGEWMILPLILLLIELVRSIKAVVSEILEFKKMEDFIWQNRK